MTDVFLSYSRKDRPRVEKLAAALEGAGYSVWWDKNLTGGGQFSKETEAQLNAAKAVVVAWSKTSISSMWVADEATIGRDKRNLLPIAIDAVEPPIGFRQIQAIDFSNWSGLAGEAEFQSLNTTLAALLERAPAVIAPVPLWRKTAAKILKPQSLAVAAAILALVVAVSALVIGNQQGDGRKSAVGPKSAVAVLPFVNEGGERDDYLSAGFGDELRNALMRVGGLQVSSPASSRAFRDVAIEAPKIAERLGVGQLIEGSLRKDRGRLHVSVQIVDGRTGFQSWSQTYERAALDVVAVQKEIAAAVAVALTGREGAAGEIAPPASRDYSANDKMLLARHREQEVRDAQVVDEAKLGEAIDLYREAVAADPNSALLHSRLAGALLYAGDADAAESEIFRALSLDPNLSEVQYTLGDFYYARELPGVDAAYQRAAELNPNNADAMSEYARSIWSASGIAKAEGLFRRALELDPLSLRRYEVLGYHLGVSGQRDKLLAVIQEMTHRFADARSFSSIGQLFELTGDFDLAVAAVNKGLSLDPQSEDLKAQLAELYAEIGDFETADFYEPEPGLGQLFWRRDYGRLIDHAEDLALERPEEAQIWYMLAFAYSVHGDDENAVRVLKLAGLPDKAKTESQVGNDVAAMTTLAVALSASGSTEEARVTAEWVVAEMKRFVEFGADQGGWANTLLSCGLAVLGRDDEAMATFAHVNDGPGLPRLPWLKDYPCFKRFAADKRYTSVIAAVEKRRAELRAKVAAMDPGAKD